MKHPVAQQAVVGAHDGRVSEEQELVHGQVGKHADGDRALHVDVPSETAGDGLQFESVAPSETGISCDECEESLSELLCPTDVVNHRVLSRIISTVDMRTNCGTMYII